MKKEYDLIDNAEKIAAEIAGIVVAIAAPMAERLGQTGVIFLRQQVTHKLLRKE